MSNESYLGIDIGTTAIKAVEKSADGTPLKWGILDRRNRPFQTSIHALDEKDATDSLKLLLERMWSNAREAVFSVPAFLAYTSLATEVDPTKIPIAPELSKLDAILVNNSQVFLIAIPNAVIEKYARIAYGLGLKLIRLELESAAAARQLATGTDKVLIADVGFRSTTFTVASHGVPLFVEQTDFAVASYAPDVIIKKLEEIAGEREVKKIILTGGGAESLRTEMSVAPDPALTIANGLQRTPA